MNKLFLTILVAFLMGLGAFAKEQPNFLIIMADDCTYNDLPLYGGQNAKTPNINRLAASGLTFNRAYLGEAMCQPSRAELFTAMYALRNGCAWNHSASRPGLTSMPHHLGALGYRVGLAGKGHVKPQSVFPFQSVEGFDPNCVRNPTRAHDVAGITQFMSEGKGPFCLVVALVEPHVPWVMGDASQYPPKQLKLPANIADTPRTRIDFSKYLAEITYMDGQVGEILTALEKTGKARDTLVLFTSEQGSQFPGCKWTNWNTGLHTALVARWPGHTPAGKRTDALVQYADILPTLLSAAGGSPVRHQYDGTSFLEVLKGQAQTHRKFVYGIHNNLPEGPAYPIRSVSDGTYRYIRNLRPDELYIEKHLMGGKGDAVLKNPYWPTWLREAWTNPKTYQLVKRYMRRPAEELYHTEKDPYELTNLALTRAHAGRLSILSAELDRWMAGQGDPGRAVDTPEALKAAREGKHLHGPQNNNTDR
ncbi:MAG: heparan N-sulfatase [Verrucomicrobiales bacterium]|nr:heparan N-sulfatase [Verrucomicrobiales bacterium]|tara:strand:- start:25 stop:1455 length:1431 start_codon:yes stop_codon:yes gene_type:complete